MKKAFIVRCGTFPVFSFRAATSAAVSMRMVAAMALPSMISAPEWKGIFRGYVYIRWVVNAADGV